MKDIYLYVADAYPMEKIDIYKDTVGRLLAQTTECSYFIGDYRRIMQFGMQSTILLLCRLIFPFGP